MVLLGWARSQELYIITRNMFMTDGWGPAGQGTARTLASSPFSSGLQGRGDGHVTLSCPGLSKVGLPGFQLVLFVFPGCLSPRLSLWTRQ